MPQGCGSMWPVGPPRATSECNKGDVAFLHSIDYRFNSIGIVLLVPSVLHFFLYYSYATPPLPGSRRITSGIHWDSSMNAALILLSSPSIRFDEGINAINNRWVFVSQPVWDSFGIRSGSFGILELDKYSEAIPIFMLHSEPLEIDRLLETHNESTTSSASSTSPPPPPPPLPAPSFWKESTGSSAFLF